MRYIFFDICQSEMASRMRKEKKVGWDLILTTGNWLDCSCLLIAVILCNCWVAGGEGLKLALVYMSLGKRCCCEDTGSLMFLL